MSTEIGELQGTGSRGVAMSVCRYYGGDSAGVCVQLTAEMERGGAGYVQLSTADILALFPILKKLVVDVEMNRQFKMADEAITAERQLEKTIIHDRRECARWQLGTGNEVINLLFYGKQPFVYSDEIEGELNGKT